MFCSFLGYTSPKSELELKKHLKLTCKVKYGPIKQKHYGIKLLK